MTMSLSNNVLFHILSYACPATLAQCSRVNRDLCFEASKWLYEIVLYEGPAPFSETRTNGTEQLHSAILSSYHDLVRQVQVRGHIRDASTIDLQHFPNLDSFTYMPISSELTEEEHLKIIASINCGIRSLSFNSLILGTKDIVNLLTTRFQSLRVFRVSGPNRALLSALPSWLERLRNLDEFHLLDNCGSVTPGVLASMQYHLRTITSFSLGLSYSLMDKDIFYFLQGMPQLEELQLVYHLQFFKPPYIPSLPALKNLTVYYNDRPVTRIHGNRLACYIRWIIHDSPQLRTLRIRASDLDDELDACGARPKFSGLIEHLIAKHSKYIRDLDLKGLCVGGKELKKLLKECGSLECLAVTARPADVLECLDPSQLRRFVLHLMKDKQYKHRPNQSDALRMMRDGQGKLRQIVLNKDSESWEGKFDFRISSGQDTFEVTRDIRATVDMKPFFIAPLSTREDEDDELANFEKSNLADIIEEEEG